MLLTSSEQTPAAMGGAALAHRGGSASWLLRTAPRSRNGELASHVGRVEAEGIPDGMLVKT